MAYVQITQNQTSHTNASAVLNADGEAIRISDTCVRVNIHWSIYTAGSALASADRALHLLDGENNSLGQLYIGGSWASNRWYESWQSMDVWVAPGTGASALSNVGVAVLGPGGQGGTTLTWDGSKQTGTGDATIQRTNLSFDAWNTSKPVVHRAVAADASASTYAVFAYVTGSRVTGVNCAAWTEAGGQDDLVWHDMGAGSWERYGQKFNYAVVIPRSGHKNEYGLYINHVYARNDSVVSTPAGANGYWTPTVRFNGNGGSSGGSHGVKYQTAIGSLPSSSRTGYTLKGWYTAPSGGSKIAASTVLANVNAFTYGMQDYYAQWTANTYYVAYNGNGATSGSTAKGTHTYDTAKALTGNGFARTGHAFAGWATSAGGSVAYSNAQSVKNLTATAGGTVNLYAKWTANKYTLTFNSNGGSAVSSKSVTYDSAYGTLIAPTRTNYEFSGWYTAASGGTAVTADTICKGNATIYARWKEIAKHDRVVIMTAANVKKMAKPYIYTANGWKGASAQAYDGAGWKKTKLNPNDF